MVPAATAITAVRVPGALFVVVSLKSLFFCLQIVYWLYRRFVAAAAAAVPASPPAAAAAAAAAAALAPTTTPAPTRRSRRARPACPCKYIFKDLQMFMGG